MDRDGASVSKNENAKSDFTALNCAALAILPLCWGMILAVGFNPFSYLLILPISVVWLIGALISLIGLISELLGRRRLLWTLILTLLLPSYILSCWALSSNSWRWSEMTVDVLAQRKFRDRADIIERISRTLPLENPLPPEAEGLHWASRGLQDAETYISFRVTPASATFLAKEVHAKSGQAPSIGFLPHLVRDWWKPTGSDLLIAGEHEQELWIIDPTTGVVLYHGLAAGLKHGGDREPTPASQGR